MQIVENQCSLFVNSWFSNDEFIFKWGGRIHAAPPYRSIYTKPPSTNFESITYRSHKGNPRPLKTNKRQAGDLKNVGKQNKFVY